MRQKENLEYHAVTNFIKEYNRSHKRKIVFRQLYNPPMPDALCELNGKEIGIEVVHSYGSGIEAAVRLGNRKTSDFPEKYHRIRRVIPLNERAISSLNKKLLDKSKKSYSFSPVWLLVRNAFVLWSISDYKHYKNDIFMPGSHPFKQIWLLCDKNSLKPHGIIRLV